MAAPPADPPHEPPAAPGPFAPPNKRDALQAAIKRHNPIERTIRECGPNPLPRELGETSEHLRAFVEGGPLECELIQEDEEAVEPLVEMDSSAWDGEYEPPLEERMDRCVSLYPERDTRRAIRKRTAEPPWTGPLPLAPRPPTIEVEGELTRIIHEVRKTAAECLSAAA